MWYHGILQPTLWQLIVATLALTHVSIISVTLYLHRHSSSSLGAIAPCAKALLPFLAVADDGNEHPCVDGRSSPASCLLRNARRSAQPEVQGLLTVLLRGAELYRAEARNPETCRPMAEAARTTGWSVASTVGFRTPGWASCSVWTWFYSASRG